jgi:glycosyltransferase involved in cell wall biosynthesis
MNKRILQINTVVNWGATGIITEKIGKVILKNSWSSFIAYGRYDRLSDSKLIKIGNKFDFYADVLKTRLFDEHGFGSENATNDFIEKVKKIKPDIIHLHNIHGYYINIKILFEYLKQSNLPVVWTLHDCWSFTGHCAHYTVVDCQKWQKQCYSCPQTSRYPASIFLDNSKKNYLEKKTIFNSLSKLTLIPVSEWLEGEVRKSFFKDVDIKMINNGIDLEMFNIRKLNLSKLKYKIPKKFIILGVASVWTKEKGLNDFIELRELLGNDIQIVLIGLNKSQLKKMPIGITGIERTENQRELADMYNLADVYINLTWEDTFPTTNLEAIACGTPIITYDVGGSPEAITPETGFVVQKKEYFEIIEKVKEIKANGKDYYSTYCRERALQKYNQNDRFKEYFNLYEEILGHSDL